MRLAAALAVMLLASTACAARKAPGPAWPKQSEKEVDGGESLEPRQAVAIEEADDEEEEDSGDEVAEAPAEKPAEKPAEPKADASPPPPTVEEPMITEEIVIEIEE